MSFNTEIEPFVDALEVFRKAKTWKEGIERTRVIKDIYLKYLWEKGQKIPCNNCTGTELARMLQRINFLRDGLIVSPRTLETLEELKKPDEEMDLEIVVEIPATDEEILNAIHVSDDTYRITIGGQIEKDIVDLDKLTLEELRLECDRRGIKYHHLNKEPKLRSLLK